MMIPLHSVGLDGSNFRPFQLFKADEKPFERVRKFLMLPSVERKFSSLQDTDSLFYPPPEKTFCCSI
jgi:hypothetical protein